MKIKVDSLSFYYRKIPYARAPISRVSVENTSASIITRTIIGARWPFRVWKRSYRIAISEKSVRERLYEGGTKLSWRN